MTDIHLQEALYSQLTSLGNFYQLRHHVSPEAVEEQLRPYGDKWVTFNPYKKGFKRYGLSVTSLDGKMTGHPDLTSLAMYNEENEIKVNEMDFNQTTELYENCPEIQSLISDFKPYLGRTHFIKLDTGGLFPYHRDGYTEYDNTFRLFVPLYRHASRDYVFLLGMKRIFLEAGSVYFINARIEHALFSMAEESVSMIMNVKICPEAIALVKRNLLSV